MLLTGGAVYAARQLAVTSTLQVVQVKVSGAPGPGLAATTGGHGRMTCLELEADLEGHQAVVDAAWEAVEACIQDPQCTTDTLMKLMEGWSEQLAHQADAQGEYDKQCGRPADLAT